MEIQKRLVGKEDFKTVYNYPQVNYIKGGVQRIETSRGCPRLCPYCKEPDKLEVFDIPRIISNCVEILDMNFLWQPNILDRIKQLGRIKVNNKVVYYDEVCGFDFRFMSQEIANELKKSRFINIRIAWDWYMNDQYKIKDCLKMLFNAGFSKKEISCFMIVNWKIPKKECERKMDLLKIWNIKICDCCYDGGYKIAVPEFWEQGEIEDFRADCRKHNQLVNFEIDPEIKPDDIRSIPQ
jgi:hypothetical protein